MAKATLPLLPFPDDISRHDFGHYISGFTDGEGYFGLGVHGSKKASPKVPCATFVITLRGDDLAILRLFHSYFGCGSVSPLRVPKSRSQGYHTFYVHTASSLAAHIIPHFEAFPLRAKKARDFSVWREGVLYMLQIQASKRAGCRYRGDPQFWTAERIQHFLTIKDRLQAGRQFDPLALPPPPPPPRTLFDGLP